MPVATSTAVALEAVPVPVAAAASSRGSGRGEKNRLTNPVPPAVVLVVGAVSPPPPGSGSVPMVAVGGTEAAAGSPRDDGTVTVAVGEVSGLGGGVVVAVGVGAGLVVVVVAGDGDVVVVGAAVVVVEVTGGGVIVVVVVVVAVVVETPVTTNATPTVSLDEAVQGAPPGALHAQMVWAPGRAEGMISEPVSSPSLPTVHPPTWVVASMGTDPVVKWTVQLWPGVNRSPPTATEVPGGPEVGDADRDAAQAGRAASDAAMAMIQPIRAGTSSPSASTRPLQGIGGTAALNPD